MAARKWVLVKTQTFMKTILCIYWRERAVDFSSRSLCANALLQIRELRGRAQAAAQVLQSHGLLSTGINPLSTNHKPNSQTLISAV
jgi:hypothetical protein